MNHEARGISAERILNDEIYKEAYAQIEANIIAQMAQQSTPADKAEDLRKLLIALRKVRTYMEQVVATGTMEALNKRQSTIQSLFKRA
jgi:predicted alternative tryptophan synthase beta-subunit